MNDSPKQPNPWLAVFGVIVVISVGFDLVFCAACPLVFQFNLILVLLVPLTLLEAAAYWLVCLGKSLVRPTRFRITVRGMMASLALLAAILGTARWWVEYNFATVYAPGYHEENFRRVKLGMTEPEVESILGQPLLKDSTSPRWRSCENWIYSQPPPPGTIGDNYWRRWVMFNQGKVIAIVDDYYVD